MEGIISKDRASRFTQGPKENKGPGNQDKGIKVNRHRNIFVCYYLIRGGNGNYHNILVFYYFIKGGNGNRCNILVLLIYKPKLIF